MGRDNRNYEYETGEVSVRREFEIITEFIPENQKVLDLGCGDGTLMQMLRDRKGATADGIELVPSGVEVCKEKGFACREGRIDVPLEDGDQTYDYAICNVTIQMVMYPETLLREMKRVARRQIISFPNFGFYKNRLEMLLNGRMPRSMLFGYRWYDTGHIHQLSNCDFLELIEHVGGLNVVEDLSIRPLNPLKGALYSWFPNLFGSVSIFVLETR